jgi:hypothetical protein
MTACKDLLIFIDHPDAPIRDDLVERDKNIVVDAVD